VLDSGIDNQHPAIDGAVKQWVEPVVDKKRGAEYNLEPHEDLFGHGTACAGLIREIAPDAELISIRVLGRKLSGNSQAFLAGLRWAIDNAVDVCNLSLGSTNKDFFSEFHELVDEAYHRGMVLVTAANNMPVVSFPSLYAAVLSVACYEGSASGDPLEFYCNPSPPVEFGAHGTDVRIPWLRGGYITATGNSFAAPQITGIVAKLLGKNPELTPFQVKTVLRAVAPRPELAPLRENDGS
jgi:subtilisin family serine protease